MKSIKAMNVDGYDIVTHILSAGGFIDAEATKKIVNKEIQKTDVFKSIATIKKQMRVYMNQAAQAKRNEKNVTTKEQKDKIFTDWKKYVDLATSLQDDLKPLGKELKEKFSELMLKHAVYFNPPKDEFLVSDTEAQNISDKLTIALDKNMMLTKDLKEIPCFKFKKFWTKIDNKWVMTDIKKIGVLPPKNSIEESCLNDEQKQEIKIQLEKERISNLKVTEKDIELNAKLDSLKKQAVQMRSELEIMNDENSLVKAQDWLAVETEKINTLYK